MKRIKIMMIALMMTIVTSASAMTYDQAKQQALFLADKMAYELNLTEEQYEAAYEINLDYLMAVNDYSDVYGTYWSRRNLELQSILTSWQYNAYIAADYFYRPVYWSYNTWNWRIYSYYPTTTWYNARPTVYVSYRGGAIIVTTTLHAHGANRHRELSAHTLSRLAHTHSLPVR